MRHLIEQVKRNGPLWLFSAFCFESANHHLLSALSGTVKNPEKIVDRFLRHQISFAEMQISDKKLKVNFLTNFTKVTEEVRAFCLEQKMDLIFSRYCGEKKFCSNSYSRLNGNLGESVLMLSNGNLISLECFANRTGISYAVVRQFESVEEIKLGLLKETSFAYIFKLSGLGDLRLIKVDDLKFKTIFYPNGKILHVSVMKEGFEHN